MNLANLNKLHYGSTEAPLKRKRGRPRKHPKPDVEDNGNIPKNQNLKLGGHPPVTLGLDAANITQPLQREPVENAQNPMIGQLVSGVVEAVFDAGFLLSVRVGNSNTSLKGVVFKPGRYVPISAENDVAPDVKMIQRNEVPLPTVTCNEDESSCSKGKTEQNVNINRNESLSMDGLAIQLSRVTGNSSNVAAAKTKHLSEVIEQSTLSAGGGKFVPVNLSGIVSVTHQPSVALSHASHTVSSKGKEVCESTHPENGPTAMSQVPMAGNQATSSQLQPAFTKGVQNEDNLRQRSSEELRELDAESMGPGMPFEKLPSEFLERIPAPSEATEMEVENRNASGNTLANPKGNQEVEVSNMDQGLEIRPLQNMHPHFDGQSAFPSKVSETNRKKTMDELFEEDRRENQVCQTGEAPVGAFSELK